jgi:hypothetical protein
MERRLPAGRLGLGHPVSTTVAATTENRWSGAAVRHYRAAEPRRLVEEVPLYTR